MPNFGFAAKNIGRFVTHHSPVILTSVAVAGVLSTAVLAVRGTPQAIRLMEEAQAAKAEHTDEDLTPFEVVKATYLCYIPAASVGLVTIACIISGNAISTKRNAALLSLYTLTESGFREYQDKVTEHIGKDKEEAVRADVMKDRMARDREAVNEIVILDGENKVLFYDSISGRYFKNDVQSIRRAENDLNQIILHGQNLASLNEFWGMIGLSRTEYGDEVGWTTDQLLSVSFATTTDESGEKPCFSIEYRTMPIQGYYASFLG